MLTLSIPDITARLESLVEGREEHADALPSAFETMLRNVRKDAWARVAEGDLDRPAAWLRAIAPVISPMRQHPKSWEVLRRAIEELDLAIAALPEHVPAVVASSLSETQRIVLRVVAHAEAPLARSMIHQRNPRLRALTPQAVGKAARKLQALGLLRREEGKTQGSANASLWVATIPGRQLAQPAEPHFIVSGQTPPQVVSSRISTSGSWFAAESHDQSSPRSSIGQYVRKSRVGDAMRPAAMTGMPDESE